jgi:hypothetical protein
MAGVPRVEHVTDVIAEDLWSYTSKDGTQKSSRILIGRPRPWPNSSQGDWICPIEIEGVTSGTRAIAGVGPVDALMNAMAMVKSFAEEIEPFTPRAQDHRGNV